VGRPAAVEPAPGTRVLVLSASMGAGHDGAARELCRRLEADGHAAARADWLTLVPMRLGLFIRWFYGMQLAKAPGSYRWHYRACQRRGIVFRLSVSIARLAHRRVCRLVRTVRPDVIVSTYPLASQSLGRLRELGRVGVPVVAYVTDFSVHPVTLHRSVDLLLTVSPESAEVVHQLCPRPALATGPLVPELGPGLLGAAAVSEVRAAVRTELGLPADATLALVVAGSWGVGDVLTTVRLLAAARPPGGGERAGGQRAGDAAAVPVVVCGRNAELQRAVAGVAGAVALGWRSDMPRLLVAADVLVENAGGLSCFEAFRAGLPVVSHACIPGHGVHNAEVMADAGVVTYVAEAADLAPSVDRLAADGAAAHQVATAQSVFAADAAAVVVALSRTRSITAAAAAAGPVGSDIRGRLVRPRRWLATRRRVVRLAATTTAVFYAGTAGVAMATSFGVGVLDTAEDHPRSAYVVVRIDAAEARSAAVVQALLATDAAVAVDSSVVRSDPAGVRALAASGVPLANAGHGRGERGLYDSKAVLRQAQGSAAPVYLSTHPLSAWDLSAAWVGSDRVVRPDVVLRARTRSVTLRGGSITFVDGRGDPAALASELEAVRVAAARQGLALGSLRELLRRRR